MFLQVKKQLRLPAESPANDPIAVANIPIMVKSKYCSTSVKKICMENVNMILVDILL